MRVALSRDLERLRTGLLPGVLQRLMCAPCLAEAGSLVLRWL